MANPLARLIGLGRRNLALGDGESLFEAFARQWSTSSGVKVTTDSAIASVAVLACLIVRAESLMLMPADVYQREGTNRVERPNHPVAGLIADAPNPLLSSEEFWRWKQIAEDLKGNAYARIEWYRGEPVALWPLYGAKPAVRVSRIEGRAVLAYDYAGDDLTPAGPYPATDIMHFKGPMLSRSPYEARSLIEVTSETIGLGIATEQFFARFLGNGSHFPAYLQTDSKLDDKDMSALKKQFEDGEGLLPAGRIRIFDRGLSLKSNTMSIKDADLSSHQRWILEQVCRIFRVPLPMVQDLTHGTYTNSEQADLWLSKYTATPIARNSEGVIRRKLFLPSERAGGFYSKFNVNALMRGDFATRAAGYSVLINAGVYNPNEARHLEDLNGYEGGDEFRVPLNTAAVGSEAARQENARIAVEPLLRDAKDRIEARHRQNLDRGRGSADTLAFARMVLTPIVLTATALGMQLSLDDAVQKVAEQLALELPAPVVDPDDEFTPEPEETDA